jgi:hypothetical protein
MTRDRVGIDELAPLCESEDRAEDHPRLAGGYERTRPRRRLGSVGVCQTTAPRPLRLPLFMTRAGPSTG